MNSRLVCQSGIFYFQSMNNDLLVKAVKFGLVGFSGVLLDYGVTILFKEIFLINKYVANSLGFIAAASSNYYLNRIWTFKSTNPNVSREYLLFVAVSTVGLLLNNFIIFLLNSYFKLFDFYLAKFIAIVLVFFWNFLINHIFNFKTGNEPQS